ncbi:CvpA family protein [Tautonia plasticadhaerens]|uniref:Colicin V production protein n=1 Tax=Tautonia plasticadhaerens TaxID=2527974 RepID=A0A518H2R5_9BACT|nr:CvpA family protein [Tautonia plasticadhaerens]QDV35124.1 Colicin V production protein [Tautonia plasticadhaerens]
MGMDLILGAIVLVSALRGWFRGFFSQAIRLGGLVGGVYLAGPLRDLARPIAAERMTSMSPELLDRILWWVAAVGSYVVLSGTATGLLSAYSRRMARERAASGVARPAHRGDQSAGFLFGAGKGAVVVAFLAAGIQQYSPEYLKAGGWVGGQVGTSHLLALSERYEPARRIWESKPVRTFVDHVRSMGLGPRSPGEDDPSSAEGDDTRAFASDGPPAPARSPSPMAVDPAPRRPGGEVDLDAALEEVRRDLHRLDSLRDLVPR